MVGGLVSVLFGYIEFLRKQFIKIVELLNGTIFSDF
jgi:hypothetical protein